MTYLTSKNTLIIFRFLIFSQHHVIWGHIGIPLSLYTIKCSTETYRYKCTSNCVIPHNCSNISVNPDYEFFDIGTVKLFI